MGIFKKKAKKQNKSKIPRDSKLFTILRGIDEQEIAAARKMQGFEQTRRIERGVTKIELVKITDRSKW